MKKLGKALGAIAVAGAVAAGGSAFTASNTIEGGASATLGYNTQTLTGVTATSVVFGLNAAKDTITSVTVQLTGDQTGTAIAVGFGAANPADCGDATPDFSSTTYTEFICTGLSASISSASSFKLVAES